MSGLYIHIPFCKSRCAYCGFYSTTALALRDDYVEALCRELEIRVAAGPFIPQTIYLGGGTPSMLTPQQTDRLFETIRHRCGIGPDVEVTMECNPDDINAEFAAYLKSTPVNRVSMGVQSFHDRHLSAVGRRHDSRQAEAAFNTLVRAGFTNISLDLMFGFPTESLAEWQADLDKAMQLRPQHLSAYSLMYEEDTPLFAWLENGRVAEIPDEQSRTMYYVMKDCLESHGYEHYEISNFALPGFRSRHNSSYWNDTPYLGIGAAAHSYDGHIRQWNVSDLRSYIEAIGCGELPFAQETLDSDTRYNDRITVALRTKEGLNLASLTAAHREHCLREARKFLDNGLLKISGDNLSLTRNGLFISDMIMSELMLV